jgi:hypothetical protein
MTVLSCPDSVRLAATASACRVGPAHMGLIAVEAVEGVGWNRHTATTHRALGELKPRRSSHAWNGYGIEAVRQRCEHRNWQGYGGRCDGAVLCGQPARGKPRKCRANGDGKQLTLTDESLDRSVTKTSVAPYEIEARFLVGESASAS